MPKTASTSSNRLITLDYLRGFFIVVIILDHLSRWPSIFSVITGKALLWVTAAEGFVAISGLLVGYVRGFKNKELPMKVVTMKLLSRAALLYLWLIIGSLVYTAILWYVPLQGGAPGLDFAKGEWLPLIYQTITLQETFVWVHFLALYALFLAFAPFAVWFLRKGMAWVVVLLSTAALITGYILHNEALQWQFLFFIPSVAGYYLQSIMKWWQALRNKTRAVITSAVISVTLATLLISVIVTFYAAPIQDFANSLNALFPKETITPWRAGVAFLWFLGFILLFNMFEKFIGKAFGWLLLLFGTHSLTAYILHGLALCIISYFTLASDNFWINTLLGAVCVLIVWTMVRLPIVRRVVPS